MKYTEPFSHSQRREKNWVTAAMDEHPAPPARPLPQLNRMASPIQHVMRTPIAAKQLPENRKQPIKRIDLTLAPKPCLDLVSRKPKPIGHVNLSAAAKAVEIALAFENDEHAYGA